MTNQEGTKPIYPCPFPIKVMGENQDQLEEIIVKVMASFGEVIKPHEFAIKESQNGKYVSITFRIIARSREYIDQIYAAFTSQKEVIMVL
jgi:putative lipoic acid-binding regulatory protein